MLRKKKGQSTLEYIIVFSAIVAAILIFAYQKLNPAVEKILNSTATEIEDASDKFGQLINGT